MGSAKHISLLLTPSKYLYFLQSCLSVYSLIAMSVLQFTVFTWMILSMALGSSSLGCSCAFNPQGNMKFEQKVDRFWEFKENTNRWVEIELPYDLVSCANNKCAVVGSIKRHKNLNDVPKEKESPKNDDIGIVDENRNDYIEIVDESFDVALPLRKRISLTKVSDTSIWVTGISGSIYERFWNDVQWVIAPHDLPISAGPAISIFIVNQTIFALSEEGLLYQLQLSESAQPVWVECMPTFDHSINGEVEPFGSIYIESGAVSRNGERIHFSTKSGQLLEITETEPLRWINHGQPPGADVAAIAEAGQDKTEVVFVISSTGQLYEYDRSTKPSWKKHLWKNSPGEDVSLLPFKGCIAYDISRPHLKSLFLLTKAGKLVERRLHHRRWKWIIHGKPKGHNLTSITQVVQDQLNEDISSLFCTTSIGFVFEYQIPKHSGFSYENQNQQMWVNHMHPSHAKVARGIPGVHFQVGRVIFPLDDGRLAELHVKGLGGENSGPGYQLNVKKRSSLKYMWTILDAPMTEGWNAEYCSEEQGPTNCIRGIKDEPNYMGISRSVTRRRRGSQQQECYMLPLPLDSNTLKASREYSLPDSWVRMNFGLRVLYENRSFFLISNGGLIFEYFSADNIWLWLKHEHSTRMKGLVGNYMGSLFMVDTQGSLLIRERNSNGLAWINCTAMKEGGQVIGGPPWDGLPGSGNIVTAEDALFFIGKDGRLLQFTVGTRKFIWKDCGYPPASKIASIVDQELFRENIIFVIGRNGRLYQYNKVTDLWHGHYQSPHLVLSRLPGTAMKPLSLSLTGSLFMVSEDGALVEYHWNPVDGWSWAEHGTPHIDVTFPAAPGPCFRAYQLFLIGSDGQVYLRYKDQSTWKWKSFGFPNVQNTFVDDQGHVRNEREQVCVQEEVTASFKKDADSDNYPNGLCDPKVALTRPIPFSEDSVIFELRDGTLAEMRRMGHAHWIWTRIISTPTSLCISSYWTTLAS